MTISDASPTKLQVAATTQIIPTTRRILLSGPDVGDLEEEYLLRAFRSGWIAPVGPDLEAFEKELAEKVGVAYAVGLSSGTAALHLGLLGLGVKPGDRVITSTMTFAATANAITYCGAEPVFVDCVDDGNMDPIQLHRALKDSIVSGTRPAAIVPVDLLGRPADYDRILPIAAEFEVPVLVDAAESLGSRYRDQACGSLGEGAVVSFNGNKIMTTSGGGALLTDDENLAEYARYLSTQARDPVAHYEHREIGFNYRLSNLLAALGRAQLARLDGLVERRREIRRRYRDSIAAVTDGVTLFGDESEHCDNAWLSAILVDDSRAGFNAGELAAWLAEHDIETRPLWKPMHLQPVFAGTQMYGGGVSQGIFASGLNLPSGSTMSDADVERVIATIAVFLGPRGC
ncbi:MULTISPECIES: aminotransferase class I/II-fold pyridoxal phosphate-dependent enzyme [unclassified Brevibacterium]|uniref:DegT/DnrJ/EryC1/StrS family aminotransferase n=1 Tax=unclassified Brevibacterium TaxID=2614124 RepID=UPI001E3A7E92|nr:MULTISPECIES: aminotransferase class I/II-fold pyridoxal phosphate-dependent enzyme [unclassified Brevibacterium]MCD1286671.1 pyridoxal-5'-phosphate-dependent protein [Brevibacterium sp. CCUG 69071]MDK8434099.1 aminotransferase class I/II-fold pyridoxal phosphate-dependent enzyme [Brevibacterium sp. H-BE7]